MFTARRRFQLAVTLLISLNLIGCSAPRVQLSRFVVKIDWVPTAEYYGFFYAKTHGFYEEAGLAVSIENGTGAPAVAKQLSAGTIYAGTTTSDNLLREIANGSKFSRAIPLLRFNPCVLVVKPGSKLLQNLANIAGQRIGTNKEASVYTQFLRLLAKHQINPNSVKEVPIGYGGADVFALGDVEGFLAYTTNAAVDLAASNPPTPFSEVVFGSEGLESFGTVLVLNYAAPSKPQQLGEEQFNAFTKATLRGYEIGARDLPGAVQALRDSAPTQDPRKLQMAIEKITLLNNATRYDLQQIDRWVPNISAQAQDQLSRLLADGMQGR